MKKKEYWKAVAVEINGNANSNLIKNWFSIHLNENKHAVYLIRKQLDHIQYNKNLFGRLCAKYFLLNLIKLYNCCVGFDCTIGFGLKITHPIGIVIGNCNIGRNCHLLQHTTIGVKDKGSDRPRIGDNFILCVGSYVLGNVNICDNVDDGINSIVIHDISESGVYVGSPVFLRTTSLMMN